MIDPKEHRLDSRRDPAEDDFIVFGAPVIGEDEIQEVVRTLRSGWIGTGPKTHEFERRFAEFVGRRYALATSSGTAALHLALDALGVGPHDEVITTPLTFVATANVVEHCGARPVFVDVRPEDGNIDPDQVARAVTDRTKVILPVHYAGSPADVAAIHERCPEQTIVVDAAHAIEARAVGVSSAHPSAAATAYSFYATKNLTTGEGGMLVTDDPAIADRVRIRRLHGLDHDAWARYAGSGDGEYGVSYPGFKYNMTDIQASLGIHQLARIGRNHERRAEIWRRYNEAFAGLEGIRVPPVALLADGPVGHALHLYTLWFDWDALGLDRATVVDRLRTAGIGTGWHFRAVHLHDYYRRRYGFRGGEFPVAEAIADSTLSLPLTPALRDSQVERVIDAVTEIAGRAA